VDPAVLIGLTFVINAHPEELLLYACIVKLIDDHDYKLENNKERIKLLLNVKNNTSKEAITHNQLLDYFAKDDNNNDVWKFKRIILHQVPISSKHPDYKGSTYNIIAEGENGEPLQINAKDDPVTCAIYAKDTGLLDTPGWKQLKSVAKCQKKCTRSVDQAKLRS
jgi:hypothetical protein